MTSAGSPSLPGNEPTIDLLHRYRRGDTSALETLLARNLMPLRRWASGRLPPAARDLRDTEDILQDTIMHVLPHLADFEYRGEGAVQAYLRHAILNRIRNEYRRVAGRPSREPADSKLHHRGPSPLDEVIGRDVTDDYERALSQLADLDQQLVVLRLDLGFGYQAIADATGKPSADAARMATARAILRLAQAMRHATDR